MHLKVYATISVYYYYYYNYYYYYYYPEEWCDVGLDREVVGYSGEVDWYAEENSNSEVNSLTDGEMEDEEER